MFKLAIAFLAVVTLGCGGSKPDPATPPVGNTGGVDTPTPLHADVETFCSAEAAGHATGLDDLGPFLEPKLGDTEVKQQLLAVQQNADLAAFHTRMQALITQEGVAACPTLDKLFSQRP